MGISGGLLAKADAKEATITAVITRADGTVENLGVVSYWHKNPIKRIWWSARQWWRKLTGDSTGSE